MPRQTEGRKDGKTEGQKDGQTLFHKTLTAGGGGGGGGGGGNIFCIILNDFSLSSLLIYGNNLSSHR